MSVKITIGEMAKMHDISTQTLRYYDHIDLFKPSYTNRETGYRYYGIEQFAHLESILFLKGTGMSLKAIKEYFKNRELGSMLKLLRERVELIENEIVKLENKKKKITSIVGVVNNYLNKDILGKCRVQYMQRRSMIFFDFEGGDIFTEHELGIKKLENVLQNIDDLYLYPFGSVIDKQQLENGEYENFKGIAMVFESECPDKLETVSLAAGLYATMTFIGTYKDISSYSERIVRWIKDENYEMTGSGIVLVITDKAFSDFEYEYISEIQIPVKKF